MTLTTVAWLVGGAGVLFLCWDAQRRLRAGSAHIRHCIDTFEPRPQTDAQAPTVGPGDNRRFMRTAFQGGNP